MSAKTSHRRTARKQAARLTRDPLAMVLIDQLAPATRYAASTRTER